MPARSVWDEEVRREERPDVEILLAAAERVGPAVSAKRALGWSSGSRPLPTPGSTASRPLAERSPSRVCARSGPSPAPRATGAA